jgi:ATP/ADP translocase
MSNASSQVNSRVRWHIASSERMKLALAAGTYFLLLCGYYMLRSLREAMALEAGREHIPLLFTLTFAVMMAVLRLTGGSSRECAGIGCSPRFIFRSSCSLQ